MSTRGEFAQVMELVYSGKLKAVIDRVYPLAEARLAHERMEKGENLGKIVLQIGN
jgi:NADPH:quinone reductase-like Zn-dependent oxidoreductase